MRRELFRILKSSVKFGATSHNSNEAIEGEFRVGRVRISRKKNPSKTTVYGTKIAQPSKEEVAGKLEAEDEYKVYSSIILSLFGDDKGQAIVIRRLSSNDTVRDFNDSNTRSVVKSDFPKLDYKTLDDFVEKNEKSYDRLCPKSLKCTH